MWFTTRSTIIKAAYIYLSLPLFVFLLSWLDYPFAFVFSLLFALAFYKVYLTTKKDTEADDELPCLSKKTSISLLGLALFWCFFAGIGYFYYQSFDYHFRNAVFRDLIIYEWPVMYDRADTPMVYYMAFWLIPAVLAKFSELFIYNAYLNFIVANVYLLIYAVFGVWLIFMLLSLALKAKHTKGALVCSLLFMLFSGLDIIGIMFFTVQEQPFRFHLDWWATFIQYSSLTTDMFWVFNQFIPTALMTLLIYVNRDIRNFGFLITLALFFSPYPSAGVGIFLVTYAGKEFWLSADKKAFLNNEIFSVQNIIGVFWLLPVVVLYFITNSDGMGKLWYIFDYTTPKRLIIFMILEYLLYAAVLWCSYKREVFFTAAIASLMLIPFFRVDAQNNFCMRASIPGLVILAVYVISFLKDNLKNKKNKYSYAVLVILFCIGAVTPLTEFYRGLYYTINSRKIALVKDEIYTLNKPFVRMPLFGWDANNQFTAKEYRSDIFWQYLSKKHKPDRK